MKRPFNKFGLLIGIGLAFIIGLAAIATTQTVTASAPPTIGAINNSVKAVFAVEGMSCGGCVATITKALSVFEGISDIWVDVAGGKAEVIYEPDKINDVKKLTDAITESGYPAKVLRIMTAEELRRQEELAQAKSLSAIAKVGDVEIDRADFEVELAHASGRYVRLYGDSAFSSQRGKQLLDNLEVQIIRGLIAEAIQLNEIERAGFEINDATVEDKYLAYLADRGTTRQAFESDLEQNDYSADQFLRRFRNRARIASYVDERIFDGTTSDVEKERRYTEWFTNAQLLAQVTYYDKALERRMKSTNGSSGCGNTCSVSQ